MFSRSIMDFCLNDETSEQAYMYRTIKIEDTLVIEMFNRSNLNNCMADETSEGL